MWIKTLILAGLTMVGCSPPYPGDGTLVGVYAAPDVANLALHGSSEGLTLSQRIEEAVHYWDSIGPQLRVVQEGQGAPGGVIPLGIDPTLPQSMVVGEYIVGEYGYACRCVTLIPDIVNWTIDPNFMHVLIAHELGHAIGLEHIKEAGIMYPLVLPLAGPTDADQAEYDRVWKH